MILSFIWNGVSQRAAQIDFLTGTQIAIVVGLVVIAFVGVVINDRIKRRKGNEKPPSPPEDDGPSA
jgi:hypothetical protein